MSKIICEFCYKEFSTKGIKYHIRYCEHNPNKSEFPKKFGKSDLWLEKNKNRKCSNQYMKAKELGLQKPSLSEKGINNIKKANTGRTWSDDMKNIISQQKKDLYASGWECKAGRCLKYDYNSPIAGNIKVDGTWELMFCEFADQNKLTWRRNKIRFPYINLKGKPSTYQPDFYIEELKSYIEVKGYETDLDRCKWSQFADKLILLRKNEIFNLQSWYEGVLMNR